jgi:predicted nuclease of predicted toxin-antitoxin system
MFRLLIDECLTPDLAGLALDRGIEAAHVNFQGLSGRPDWQLLPTIIGNDYTFVTNNRRDFLRLYGNLDVHAGLLVIVPAVRTARQMELFAIALDAIEAARFDTVNQLIEVGEDGTVTMSAWPFEGDNRP